MADPNEPFVSLEVVRASASPASVHADPTTTEEITDAFLGRMEYYQQLSSKPALHRTVLSERESTKLHEANSKLEGDCRELRDDYHSLVSKYTKLSSQYSRLKQANHTFRANSGLGAAMAAAGGIAVSVAGAITHPTVKPILLYCGIATFIYALISTFWNMFFGRDKSGPDIPEPIE